MDEWTFVVEDIFLLHGRGVMATGTMRHDAVSLRSDSKVRFIDLDGVESFSTVRGVERHPLGGRPPYPLDGDRVGLLFRPEERPKVGWTIGPPRG